MGYYVNEKTESCKNLGHSKKCSKKRTSTFEKHFVAIEIIEVNTVFVGPP